MNPVQTRITTLAGILALLTPVLAMAGPTGGQVAAGDASIHASGAVTTIEQLSSRAIINWDDFSISTGHRVDFLQNGIDAAILNRVLGGQMSNIEGALTATGRVFLLNPNGILFGAGAEVDVGSLVATTLGISDDDFLAGRMDFSQLAGVAPGFVENRGRITVADDGFAYLVAPGVSNAGLVVARFGEVALASGNRFTLDFSGSGLVSFDVSGELLDSVTGADGEPMQAAVSNSGSIQAHGGHVLLSGEVARGITTQVVNNSGIIEATSFGTSVAQGAQASSVELLARGAAGEVNGDVIQAGTIDVSAGNSNGSGNGNGGSGVGGSVSVSGGNVAQLGTIVADGATGGGYIHVAAADAVVVGTDSVTSASAIDSGDGGDIYILGDRARIASGAELAARGGATGGDGGFIETSGYSQFRIGSVPDVSAPAGNGGTWLIDPNDIDIVAGAGAVNIDTDDPFASTDDNAELGVDLITAALASGNVSVITTTEGANTQQGNIRVLAPLTYTGGAASSLTLHAHNDISVQAAISSTVAPLDVALHANSAEGGGSASGIGSVSIEAPVTTAGGSFTSTGVDIVLGTVVAGAGAVDISADGDITLSGDVSAGSVTLSAEGALIRGAGDPLVDAAAVTLQAGTAIGSAALPLLTQTLALETQVSESGGATHVANALALDSLSVTTNDGVVDIVADADTLGFAAGVLQIELDDPLTRLIDLAFTNSGGAVQLGTAMQALNVGSNRLDVTAAAGLSDGGQAVIAGELNLTVTDEGASIGAENVPLRMAVEQLQAQANFGHIVVRQESGDLHIAGLDTGGDHGEDDATRVIVNVPDGAIVAVGSGTHVAGWAANLTSAGAQGASGTPINTALSVLNATTDDGGIYINDTAGQLLVGNVTARERITVNGESVIITPFDSEGHVVLTTGGQAGTHNVSITAQDDIIVTGRVVAPNTLNLTSLDGSLYRAAAEGGPAFIARHLHLNAAGTVGQAANPFMTQSSWFSASAGDGGVYANESHTLRIADVSAAGEDGDVRLTASIGDVQVDQVSADGHVEIESTRGRITRTGAGPEVSATSALLTAEQGIGSAAAPIRTVLDSVAVHNTGTGTAAWITNTGALDGVDARTANGGVDVTFDTGFVRFTQGNSTLSVSAADPLALHFENTAGNLAVGSIDLGREALTLQASGSIVQASGGLLHAGETVLVSGGSLGSGSTPVALDVTALDATAAGSLYASNAGALVLDASVADDIEVTIQAGAGNRDLSVQQVQAGGTVTLTTPGALLAAGDAPVVAGENGAFTAGTGIGSVLAPFTTALTGELSASSSVGDIYLSNSGNLDQVDIAGSGVVALSGTGNLHLGSITGTSVAINTTGHVRDANGAALNIDADTLEIRSRSVGQSGTPVEIRVADLDVITSNGGIHLVRTGSGDLRVAQLIAGGSGSHIVLTAAADILLGIAEARGDSVTIETTSGRIEDGRLPGETRPNVRANSLSISATDGIGTLGDLTFDVSYLSARGGAGAVSASNLSPVSITPESLTNKGSGGVTIRAAGITVLDNNGGTITMDPNGSLTLIAEVGNIVFLNLNDTIETQGGDIRFEALGVGAYPGENGVIIVGNLVSNGGDISLLAEGNITIGLLDAGFGQGDILVQANNGIILDANGAADNLIGRHVTLVARMPSLRDAELTETQAIARYEAKQGEAAAKQTLTDTLEASGAVLASGVSLAQMIYNQAVSMQSSVQRDLNREQLRLDILNVTRLVLISTRQAAQIVRDVAAFVTGAAQAIPFSGDAGADAAFAAVDVAFSIADAALMAFDESFSSQNSVVEDLKNDLMLASANAYSSLNSLNSAINGFDANEAALSIAIADLIAALIARDASGMVRSQAIAAVDQRNMVGSGGSALGIQAERVDIQSFTDTDIYLRSDGDLGVGNVTAQSRIIISDVAGDLTLLGQLQAGERVVLDIDGAIVAVPDSLILAEELVAIAGSGIGVGGGPVYTGVGSLAADGGTGGVWIENQNGGDPLFVTAIDGVAGVSGAGDITLITDGDLVLERGIVDTMSAHTVHLQSGGSIVDDNGPAMNVTAERLVAIADGGIELDTAVDRITATSLVAGDIEIRQSRAVELTSVHSNDGLIRVDAAGDIDALEVVSFTDAAGNDIELSAGSGGNFTAGSIFAGSDHGQITIAADGRIDHDGDAATQIAGSRLNLTAGGAIGGTGTNADRPLRTQVGAIDAQVTGTGEINISEVDDVDILRATTASGGITLTSATGSLHVDTISTSTDDTVTLLADGSVTDLRDDGSVNIAAGSVAIAAGAGIGSADNAVETVVANLVASAGAGGIHLTDLDGGLIIGGVTPNLGHPAMTGLAADGGDIVIFVHSPIVIDEAIFNATGDIVLFAGASSADDDIVINATVTAAGDGATIDLTASDSIQQNAAVTVTGDGAIHYTALGGDIVLAPTTLTQVGGDGDIALLAGAGDVTVGADAVVRVAADGNVRLESGGDVSLEQRVLAQVGGHGNLTISANGGSITSGEDTTLQVVGDGLVQLTAYDSVTVGNDNLLAVGLNGQVILGSVSGDVVTGDRVVATVGGSGDVGLEAGNDVQLGTDNELRVAGDGDIRLTAAIGSVAVGVENQLVVGGDGDIAAHAANDVTFSDLVSAMIDGDGLIRLSAVNGHATAGIDNTLLVAGNGGIELWAGDTLTLADRVNATIGGDGDIALTASAGDLTVGDDAVVRISGDGDVRLESGGDAALADRVLAQVGGHGDLTISANGGSMTSGDESTLQVIGNGLVLLTADDSVVIGNDNLLAVGMDGQVNLAAAGGDVVTGERLVATVGGNGDVGLEAGNNVQLGTNNELRIGTDGDIALTASTGSVAVDSDSLLSIGGDGDVAIHAANDITFSDRVSVTIDGNGAISLTALNGYAALGVDNTLLVAGNGGMELWAGDALALADRATATIGGDGDITLTASTGDLTVGDDAVVRVAGDGDIRLLAGADVTLGNGASLQVNGTGDVVAQATDGRFAMGVDALITAADGDIRIAANDDVLIHRLRAGEGVVELSSASGAIGVRPAGDGNVVAGGFIASAANGIGSADLPVTTRVDAITATNSGSGSIHITEFDAVRLDSVTVADGRIVILADGDIDADEVISATDANGNDIHLVASGGGSIRIDRIQAGDTAGQVFLTANSAGGSIRTNDNGLISGDTLVIVADSGIDVASAVNRADLQVIGTGALNLIETDAIVLDRVHALNGPVTIHAGGTVTALDVLSTSEDHDGTIAIVTAGDAVLGSLNADSQISITADGEINRSAASGQSVNLTSDAVMLTAGQGIGAGSEGAILTDAEVLEAYATHGDIRITDIAGLVLADVEAAVGDVVIVAGSVQPGVIDARQVQAGGDIDLTSLADGGIIVGALTAGSDVRITSAAGRIDSDNDPSTVVRGDRLTLSAATGIGSVGPMATRSLVTDVTTLDATVSGTGDINIIELGGLGSLSAHTQEGDITLQVAGGNVTVDSLNAGGVDSTVTLYVTAGQVAAGGTVGNVNIEADQLAVTASAGIGSVGRPVVTRVDTLAASGGSGGVYIDNLSSAALTIGSVTPGLGLAPMAGIQAAGTIGIANSGAINVEQSIASSGSDIALTSHASGADIRIDAPLITSGGDGSIDVVSGGSVVQNADVEAAGRGAVRIVAADHVTMLPDAAIRSGSGPISVDAGGTLTVGSIETASGVTGGIVDLRADSIVDGKPGVASLAGGVIHVQAGNADLALMDSLAGGVVTARVQANGRVIGGELAEDARFIDAVRLDAPRMGSNATFATMLLWQPRGLLFLPIVVEQEDGEGGDTGAVE